MAFDLATAKPVSGGGGFDLATAQPVDQPSIMDRIIASPVGRAVHNIADIGGNLLSSDINNIANGANPNSPAQAVRGAFNSVGDAIERGYQSALARNRNTPGYAAARQIADKNSRGSGFNDQVLAPVMPALAGAVGLAGGLDQSNANADAQQSAENAYAVQNPKLSAIANIIGGLATGTPERALTKAVAPAIKPIVQTAHDAGYVLPPRMMTDDAGPLVATMEGWSGKIKTAQAASEKNQEVTNALAKQAIGIPPDEDITASKIASIRAQAGQAKKSVIQSVPAINTDPEFAQATANLSGIRSSVATNFPNIAKNQGIQDLVSDLQNAKSFPTQDAFDVVQKLRQDANANFKSFDDSDKIALAQAQRTAAANIEDLIDRNLARNGYPGIQDFRDARQLLAKTYDVEGATNLATGNVNSAKLAAMAAKGRPLSGDLKTIADVHSAFPAAMQPLDRIGGVEPLSTLDLGAAALAAHSGDYGVAAGLLGKPITRAAVLSKPVQARILTGSSLNLPRIGTRQPLHLAGPLSLALPQLQQAQ